jgi:hypothetical protein
LASHWQGRHESHLSSPVCSEGDRNRSCWVSWILNGYIDAIWGSSSRQSTFVVVHGRVVRGAHATHATSLQRPLSLWPMPKEGSRLYERFALSCPQSRLNLPNPAYGVSSGMVSIRRAKHANRAKQIFARGLQAVKEAAYLIRGLVRLCQFLVVLEVHTP